MTKKHFIALADHIREHNRFSDSPFTKEQLDSLANFCARENSQFLRGRWLSYIAGECGPGGGTVKKAKA